MKKTLHLFITLLTVTTMSAQFTIDDITYTPTSATEVEVTTFPDTGATSTDVIIPETVMDGGTNYTVTSIALDAFRDSNITTLVMANTITSVGNSALRGCNALTEVTLSTALVTLSTDFARGCAVLSTVNNMANITTLNNRTFRDSPSITSLDLSGVTDAVQNGITRMPGLISASFSAIENLGGFNFFNNNALTSVNLGSSLTTISENAFEMPEGVVVTVNTETPIEPSTAFLFANSGSDPANITVLVPGATALANYSNASSAWSVFNIVDSTLSTDNPLAKEYSIYPNPTADIINISNLNSLKADVAVYNITGAKVLDKNILGSDQVNLSSLASGVYVLKINTAEGELTKRIIKE